MNRLPLLSLSLVVTLGVACSNPSQENTPAPTQQTQLKKRSQAIRGITLTEDPVSAEVQAAAGGRAVVRSFRIDSSEGEYAVQDVVTTAFELGASDPVNRPWEMGAERDQEETRGALRYLDGLVTAIETEMGPDAAYTSDYYHWFQNTTQDACDLGDFYGLVFPGLNKVYIIEAQGNTEC
jgi:hypothetical protein